MPCLFWKKKRRWGWQERMLLLCDAGGDEKTSSVSLDRLWNSVENRKRRSSRGKILKRKMAILGFFFFFFFVNLVSLIIEREEEKQNRNKTLGFPSWAIGEEKSKKSNKWSGVKIFSLSFQSSRSQPAIGVKQTPKARVNAKFSFFFISLLGYFWSCCHCLQAREREKRERERTKTLCAHGGHTGLGVGVWGPCTHSNLFSNQFFFCDWPPTFASASCSERFCLQNKFFSQKPPQPSLDCAKLIRAIQGRSLGQRLHCFDHINPFAPGQQQLLSGEALGKLKYRKFPTFPFSQLFLEHWRKTRIQKTIEGWVSSCLLLLLFLRLFVFLCVYTDPTFLLQQFLQRWRFFLCNEIVKLSGPPPTHLCRLNIAQVTNLENLPVHLVATPDSPSISHLHFQKKKKKCWT